MIGAETSHRLTLSCGGELAGLGWSRHVSAVELLHILRQGGDGGTGALRPALRNEGMGLMTLAGSEFSEKLSQNFSGNVRAVLEARFVLAPYPKYNRIASSWLR